MGALAKQDISSSIRRLEGRPPFMLDRELAEFYGIDTVKLNQARARNLKKFPSDDFCFQLDKSDITKCDIDWQGGHLPWAYTKKGAHMFATILTTPEAVEQAMVLVEGFTLFEHLAETGKISFAKAIPLPPPRKMVALPDDCCVVKKDQVIEWQGLELKSLKKTSIPFSPAEKEYMIHEELAGTSDKEIAENLNRPIGSVSCFLSNYRNKGVKK